MTATTSFFSVCCALASGNSSRVTTFSSTPPKFNFAIVFCLLYVLFATDSFTALRAALALHTEYLVLLVEVLVFDDLFAGFGELEFFEFFVETPAILDDGDTGAANE